MTPAPDAGPSAPHGARFEIGLYTFVESTPDPATGEARPDERRVADLLEEIETADRVGLDVVGIGEHHRDEYLASVPDVLLAAAAARTQRIRLSSAVTVLSSDDPVRVFQRFATLDLVSGGRAEVMAGRGSFVESFPLFGYDLREYESLFDEKLRLLLRLREEERPIWSGRHRAPLRGQPVRPRPLQEPLPVWIAVGGTPASAARAGGLGLPMSIGILGGSPAQFAPLAEVWRRAAREAGHDPSRLPLGLAMHGYLADTQERAIEEWTPAAAQVMNRIGRERGWPPYDRRRVQRDAAPDGALLLGTPERVAEKILAHQAVFGHQRVMIQLTVGTLRHDRVLHAIELLGREVAPRVRKEVARRQAAA
jgi:probable LLM family oxidoreductase